MTREELHATRSELTVTQGQANLLLEERESVNFMQSLRAVEEAEDQEQEEEEEEGQLASETLHVSDDADTSTTQSHSAEDVGSRISMKGCILEVSDSDSIVCNACANPSQSPQREEIVAAVRSLELVLSLVIRDLTQEEPTAEGSPDFPVMPYIPPVIGHNFEAVRD
jgi:hypothetical protein